MRRTANFQSGHPPRYLILLLALGAVLLAGCTMLQQVAPAPTPPPPTATVPPPTATATVAPPAPTAAAPAVKEVLFIGGYGGVHVVDPVAGKLINSIPVPGPVRETSFTPDGRRMYITAGGRKVILEINTVTQRVLNTYDLSDAEMTRTIYGMTVGHDPRQLYLHYTRHTVDEDHFETFPDELGIYDLDEQKLTKTMEIPAGTHQLIPMADGRLAVFGQDFYVVDLDQMEIVETRGLHHPGAEDENKPIDFMWFWPRVAGQEGKLPTAPVFTFGPGPEDVGGGVLVFDPTDGRLDIIELGPPEGFFSSVLSHDGKWLYQTFNYTVKVNMETKEQVAVVNNPRGSSYGINLSPDGERIYLSGAGSDLTILSADDLSVQKIIDLPSDTMDVRVAVVPAE